MTSSRLSKTAEKKNLPLLIEKKNNKSNAAVYLRKVHNVNRTSYFNFIRIWIQHFAYDLLIIQLASGEVFGADQPIALKLLGSERSFEALEGKVLTVIYVLQCRKFYMKFYKMMKYVKLDCCSTTYN